MFTYLLAVEVAAWQLWSLPIVVALSVGVGLLLGRYLGWQPSSPPAVNPAPAPLPATVHEAPAPVFSEQHWENKRATPRYKVHPTRALLSENADHAHAVEGVLLNRSLGGLGLSVDRQLQMGKILYVCMPDATEQADWLRVEVRYCRLERGRWTLGCKFVDAAS